MALSRLIQRRSGLEIKRYGFPKPVRWLSSHSSESEVEKPSQLKKRGKPRERRALAAESFVKKYMETNPWFFPKVAHIQNEVGGSWYTVKEILTNIKERMLGTTQPENLHIIDASAPVKYTAVSTVMTTQYVPHNEIGLHGHHKSTFEADQVQKGEDKEGHVRHSTAMTEAEHSSGLTVPTSSDVACTHHSSSSSEHEKLSSTRCLDQQENRTTCSLSPNSSVEMGTKSAIPGAFPAVSRLLNLFESGDDTAVSEAKNRKVEPEEALSDIHFGLRKDKNPQGKSLLSTGISQQSNSFSKRLDFHGNMSLSSSHENQPGKEVVASSQAHSTFSNMPESFTGSKNFMGIEDVKGLNTLASESITNKNRDNPVHNFFRYLEEPKQKDETNRHEIKGLVDCIKGLAGGSSTAIPKQKFSSWKTDKSCEKSQLGIQSMATLQSFDKKERNVSEECHAVRSKSNHDDSRKVLPTSLRAHVDKIGTRGFTKPTGHPQLSVLNDKEESHEILDKISIMEEAAEYKAVVKFLVRAAKESDIVQSLEKCGAILKVKFSSPEGAFYRSADVHFKTREGLLNALVKTDIMVRGVNITVEAAGEDTSKRITVPSLIGDPNVPAAVVKNPTRTVKIRQLTREISSRDVVAALESWGNNVTGFFFGTLDSVAYVEFDEEDDKETILAKHTIDVLGKQLLISRIDAPRTTVVRILLHHSAHVNQVIGVCNSLGKITMYRMRNGNTLDVHFKIAEWPNMLKILNRLNGIKVDGHKLQAQPASVFPPQILQILWRHPEERIHVKNCVRKLLQKVAENVVDKADLVDLHNFY